MKLSKAEILAANDLPTEIVNVPEWGGDVELRVLTGTELDEFQQSLSDRGLKGAKGVRIALLARTIVCDPPITEDELAKKNGAVLWRLFERASRLNGLDGRDAEKNSGGQSGGSTSA